MISAQEKDVPTTGSNHFFVISTVEGFLLDRQRVESLFVNSTEELILYLYGNIEPKKWLVQKGCRKTGRKEGKAMVAAVKVPDFRYG